MIENVILAIELKQANAAPPGGDQPVEASAQVSKPMR